jgi:hypothetical protein
MKARRSVLPPQALLRGSLLAEVLLLASFTSGWAVHAKGIGPSESLKPLTLAHALALMLERSPQLSAYY